MKIFKREQEISMTQDKVQDTKEATKPSLGSGSGSARVFQVQVRVRDEFPACMIGGMAVDQVWRDLHLQPAQMPVGVPTRSWDLENISWGVPFAQAEAHRWIVICMAESARPCSPIETRIVERRIERSWSAHEVGVITKPPHWIDEEHNLWATKPPEKEEKAA